MMTAPFVDAAAATPNSRPALTASSGLLHALRQVPIARLDQLLGVGVGDIGGGLDDRFGVQVKA
jgi:hypothetical protein